MLRLIQSARLGRTVAPAMGALGLVTVTILTAAPSRATQASQVRRPASASLPLCYVQMPGQSLKNLDKLCGVLPPEKTIPLYATDGTTPSPELIAAVQKADRAMNKAQSEAEMMKINQTLRAQLPISDRARAIQAQQDGLIKRLETGGQDHASVIDQLTALQHQLETEPSFRQAEAALSKARAYMYQQQQAKGE
jgi:hypothetical protein